MLIKVMGIDQNKNRPNFRGWPSRAAIPATITLAEAAINEPLPPKHEPKDSAHQTGIIASLPPRSSSTDFMIGIMVATKGMLSIAEDKSAENHKIIMLILLMFPCEKSESLLPIIFRIPLVSSPWTMINNPAKKNMVVQSTKLKASDILSSRSCGACIKLYMSNKIAAPKRAIVPFSKCKFSAMIKPRITSNNTLIEIMLNQSAFTHSARSYQCQIIAISYLTC